MTFIYRSAGCAFTGDALLIRGCGRTDFQVSTPQCCGSESAGSTCFCASRILIHQGLRQDRLPVSTPQCCGSGFVGSTCFCASRILIHQGLRQDGLPGICSSVLRIRIRLVLPRSWSISSRYGSGSFYHQAQIVRKTLIPTVLWLLYDFLSLKNYVNVSSKSKKQRSWRSLTKNAESISVSKSHGSTTLPRTVLMAAPERNWILTQVYPCGKPDHNREQDYYNITRTFLLTPIWSTWYYSSSNKSQVRSPEY